MNPRTVRGAIRSAALTVAVTGTLTWMPTASAQSTEPTPSASPASTETPAPDAGSVAITKNDPTGAPMAGAEFTLLDTAGQEAGRGKTDALGKLTFPDLAPGVYRLKENATGSPLHDVVADRDVIVTPGATAHLTITDPFKDAHVVLISKDDKTGRRLPGSTVNIGSGDKVLLTLTTGPKGTASGELPVLSRRSDFWVKQTKAPQGYDVFKGVKTFTAGPSAPVTVTVTNAKSTIQEPAPSGKPTAEPTGTTSTPPDKASTGGAGNPKNAGTGSSTPTTNVSPLPATESGEDAAPKAPGGSLAHTGSEAAPWILGGAGLLVAIGMGTVAITRRRTATASDLDDGVIS